MPGDLAVPKPDRRMMMRVLTDPKPNQIDVYLEETQMDGLTVRKPVSDFSNIISKLQHLNNVFRTFHWDTFDSQATNVRNIIFAHELFH